MKNFYRKTKEVLKEVAIAYAIVGSIYGCEMQIAGFTTGHVSSDIVRGLKQPHAILWEKVTGLKTLDQAIYDAVEKSLKKRDFN